MASRSSPVSLYPTSLANASISSGVVQSFAFTCCSGVRSSNLRASTFRPLSGYVRLMVSLRLGGGFHFSEYGFPNHEALFDIYMSTMSVMVPSMFTIVPNASNEPMRVTVQLRALGVLSRKPGCR